MSYGSRFCAFCVWCIDSLVWCVFSFANVCYVVLCINYSWTKCFKNCFKKYLDRWRSYVENSKIKVASFLCVILCEQVSWAPGIGIKKSPFRKLFDEDKGVTYIPWTKLPSSVQSLIEGGLIDEDSLPPRAPTAGNCYFILHLSPFIQCCWFGITVCDKK